MPLLTCNNISLGYEGKTVISDLTFSVNAGDYLCIIGENGSGKSTLMRAMLRLKSPVSGRVGLCDELRQTDIGYMPQQTVVQKDFPASVREVVRSGCLNGCGYRPYYGKAEKRAADEYMKKLGISDIAKSCYRELSGGQQQRVLLARALCAAKRVLFLDEPAAGLDPAAEADMYALITELNAGGMTVIMITHDVNTALEHASHILHIGKGTAVFCGAAADYRSGAADDILSDTEDE